MIQQIGASLQQGTRALLCSYASHICAVRRVIPGHYEENRAGIRTAVFVEKRKYHTITSR